MIHGHVCLVLQNKGKDYAMKFYEVETVKSDTHFDTDTPNELKHLLEKARHGGRHVRLFYGDRRSGKDWHEENKVLIDDVEHACFKNSKQSERRVAFMQGKRKTR
jgi:hypothetical protein